MHSTLLKENFVSTVLDNLARDEEVVKEVMPELGSRAAAMSEADRTSFFLFGRLDLRFSFASFSSSSSSSFSSSSWFVCGATEDVVTCGFVSSITGGDELVGPSVVRSTEIDPARWA